MKGIRRKKGEKWLPIAGFNGYMISSCGRVYSIKRKKALKPIHVNKYLYVKLFNNGQYFMIDLNHINSTIHVLDNLCSWEDEKPTSIEWLLGKKDKNE